VAQVDGVQPQTPSVPPPPQVSLSVHVRQATPPVPQRCVSCCANGTHPSPSQQPLEQLIASQTQLVPSQRWPELHVAHSAPPVPHALSLVPRLQLFPAQQPVPQLVPSQTHDPFTQRWPGAQATSQEPQC
jgi:hypothetical protein